MIDTNIDATTHTATPKMWRTATLSAPIVFQGALALLFAVSWSLGKWVFPMDTGLHLVLTAGSILSTATLTAIGWAMLRKPTPRLRGWAYSVLGSAAALMTAGLAVAAFYGTQH